MIVINKFKTTTNYNNTLTNNLSVMFWIKLSNQNRVSRESIIDKNAFEDLNITLEKSDSNQISFYCGNSTKINNKHASICAYTGRLPFNEWVHVCFVRDDDNKKINIYINSKLKNSYTYSYSIINNNQNIFIGKSLHYYLTDFTEDMKFLKIINKKIPVSELNSIVNYNNFNYYYEDIYSKLINIFNVTTCNYRFLHNDVWYIYNDNLFLNYTDNPYNNIVKNNILSNNELNEYIDNNTSINLSDNYLDRSDIHDIVYNIMSWQFGMYQDTYPKVLNTNTKGFWSKRECNLLAPYIGYGLTHVNNEGKIRYNYGSFQDGTGVYIKLVIDYYLKFKDTSNIKDDCLQSIDLFLDFLNEILYDNGGIPEYYPLQGYHFDNICLNDGAYVNYLRCCNFILDSPIKDYLDATKINLLQTNYNKSFDLLLDLQVEINGIKTIWAQQYDPITLLPAAARSFENESLCSLESTQLLIYLMSLKNPSEKLKNAIYNGCLWMQNHKISGYVYQDNILTINNDHQNYLYSRYYDLDTQEPVFWSSDSSYTLDNFTANPKATTYTWLGKWGDYLLENFNYWKKINDYSEINIGLIGLGPRMDMMYDALIKSNNIKIKSICDIQNDQINRYITKLTNDGFNNITTYQKYKNMLKYESIDAIVISLPHHLNGFISNECVKKGIKYIYGEKPIFFNINEGYSLINTINNNNIYLQVGSQLHSSNNQMNGVRLIRNNGIGDILDIEFIIPWYPSNKYFNSLNDSINNNNLTHDHFNLWLKTNSHYISNKSDVNNNLLIKSNNNCLNGNWRDTIEYGGGLATAIGFHWWGFLFKCLDLTYDDFPIFKFLPNDNYFVMIEIECSKKFKNNILIKFKFDSNNDNRGIIFNGSDGKWMKYNSIVTTNVNIDEIIKDDITLDCDIYDEMPDSSSIKKTNYHVNNWIKSIRYNIKPNFPLEEAFYANNMCLIINALYNSNFNSSITWTSKTNIFDTDNTKFLELINWKMYNDIDKSYNLVIQNSTDFTVKDLGNSIYNDDKHYIVFSAINNTKTNIYITNSDDWSNSKIINNGSKPFIIQNNNVFKVYYIDENTNKLKCYTGNDFNNLTVSSDIKLSGNDFIIDSYVITYHNNKFYIIYKINSVVECANSDDGITWTKLNYTIDNNEIIYVSDIIYFNNIHYLSCICLSTNSLRLNDNQFSTKILYSYDLENWNDLLNQELLLEDFSVNNKSYYSNPYHYENPENNDDIILYKYGCKFLKNTIDEDITTNIYFNTLNGIIIRYSQ